ncbi:hypothetical protein ACVW1A_000419 [Bradyrhizobium sp. LB1.3]
MRPCENFGRISAPRWAAAFADEARLDVGEPDIVGPAVRVGFDVMAAAVVAAIDQDIAGTGLAHLAEVILVG